MQRIRVNDVAAEWHGAPEEAPAVLLAAIVSMLAAPSRLLMVNYLARAEADEERGVATQEFVPLLDIHQPTVSAHLKKLRACGLVRQTGNGFRKLQWLDEEPIMVLAEFLRELAEEASSQQRTEAADPS